MITQAQPYYNYRSYLLDQYNCELYSIPIDLNFGCPHRNPDNSGGCTFCPESGARAQQTTHSNTIEEQVADAVDFAKRRYGAKKFMAYIQAYTGTFASASKQSEIYSHILTLFPFEAVHIGTRPDCLDDETLDFLTALQKKLDVKVELGIQTANNKTLSRINRGHTWEQSTEAVHRLHSRVIPAIAHVILGLPDETMPDFLSTADKLAKLPLAGIKIHNLHIIKNTTLADEYARQSFHLLNEHEYLDALIEFIRRTPHNIPVLRIQTDTPENELIAPLWNTSKGHLIEALIQHMNWRMAYQGELTSDPPPNPYIPKERELIYTDDESITFWSPMFKEHYHTSVGARSETIHKYINPSKLTETLARQNVRLLDVCFGLGYNTLYACKTAINCKGGRALDIVTLEIDKGVVNDAAMAAKDEWSRNVISNLLENETYSEDNISIKLYWGDARHTTSLLPASQLFDIIFLDAFSTQRNSELWTVEFFSTLRSLMSPDGILLTYCSSLPVIAGLIEAGFYVGQTPSVGRIRGGTIASLSADKITESISEKSLTEIKATTRGIPYRDPYGTASNRNILKAREEIVKIWKQNQTE